MKKFYPVVLLCLGTLVCHGRDIFDALGKEDLGRIGDLEVLTTRTTGFSEGFLVKVDGLTIYFGGDSKNTQGSWERFSQELDFLVRKEVNPNIVFLRMLFWAQGGVKTSIWSARSPGDILFSGGKDEKSDALGVPPSVCFGISGCAAA